MATGVPSSAGVVAEANPDDLVNDSSFSVDRLNRSQHAFRLIDMLVRLRYLKNLTSSNSNNNASETTDVKSNLARISQQAADQFGITDVEGLLSDVELACVTQRRAHRDRVTHPSDINMLSENKAFELQLKKRLAVHYVRASTGIPDEPAERGAMVRNMYCVCAYCGIDVLFFVQALRVLVSNLTTFEKELDDKIRYKIADGSDAASKEQELINNYKHQRALEAFADGVFQAVKVIGMTTTIAGAVYLFSALFSGPSSAQ